MSSTKFVLKYKDSDAIPTSLTWDSSVIEVNTEVAQVTHLSPSRQRIYFIFGGQRFTLPSTAPARVLRTLTTPGGWGPSTPVDSTASRSEVTLYVEDRGSQISTRLTFVLEYAIPALVGGIALALALFKNGSPAIPTAYTLHFIRRVVESIFVHSFSRKTMPVKAALRNLAHYWITGSAAVLAAALTPANASTHGISGLRVLVPLIFWLLTEAGNSYCHIYLALLRIAAKRADWSSIDTNVHPHSTLTVKVGGFNIRVARPAEAQVAWQTKHMANPEWPCPLAWPFNHSAAPNYGFEILGWLMLTIAAPGWIAGLIMGVFMVCGAFFMAKWAKNKSAYYRMHYSHIAADRGLLLPF